MYKTSGQSTARWGHLAHFKNLIYINQPCEFALLVFYAKIFVFYWQLFYQAIKINFQKSI